MCRNHLLFFCFMVQVDFAACPADFRMAAASSGSVFAIFLAAARVFPDATRIGFFSDCGFCFQASFFLISPFGILGLVTRQAAPAEQTAEASQD